MFSYMSYSLPLLFSFVAYTSALCDSDSARVALDHCDGLYSELSCKLPTCRVNALLSQNCDTSSSGSVGRDLQKSMTDMILCNTAMDELGCSLAQMDRARICMAASGETCWRIADDTCTQSCYRAFTQCLIQTGCNFDRNSSMNLTAPVVCYHFRPLCSFTGSPMPHTQMCDASIQGVNPQRSSAQTSSGLQPDFIGAIVASLVVLLAGAIVIYVWRRRNVTVITITTTSATPNNMPEVEKRSPSPNERALRLDPDRSSPHSSVNLKPSFQRISPKPSLLNVRDTQAVVDQVRKGLWQKGKVIGSGANGTVHIAILEDGSLIAMKRMSIQENSREEIDRNLSELALVTRLNHPNIVRYFYAAHTEDPPSLDIFMEFVQGGSLGNLVKRVDEPLNEAIVRRYARQILEGLKYLHGEGVIHRDLKADNVLLSDTGCIKISDFGTAKFIQDGDIKCTTVVGSPYWMAPEVMQGNYTMKADIWSFGVLLYELLNNGRVPYPAFDSVWDAVYAIGHGQVQPVIPDDIRTRCPIAISLVQQCFIVEPEKRPSAGQLLAHGWFEVSRSEEKPQKRLSIIPT